MTTEGWEGVVLGGVSVWILALPFKWCARRRGNDQGDPFHPSSQSPDARLSKLWTPRPTFVVAWVFDVVKDDEGACVMWME